MSNSFSIPPPPPSGSQSPHPIHLDTFSRPIRQTIPYKQFQKAPVPYSQPAGQGHDRHSESEEEGEDWDFDGEEEEFDGREPENSDGIPLKGRSMTTLNRDGSTTGIGEGQSRRRNTLLSDMDGAAESGQRPSRHSSREKGAVKLGEGAEDSELEMGANSEEEGLTDDEETGLTEGQRKTRGRRKRKNTLMESRVAGSSKISKEVKKEADQNVVKNLVINAILIGLWYIFSLSISIYNKWMFSPDHLDFHFPLFTTSMHMLVQFLLASLVLFFFPRFRPRHDSLSNPDLVAHATESERVRHAEESKKPLMTKWFYASRLGPCGVATGLDIGLGNMSLKFITLTFYTMVKSSSLAFVLLFAFAFHLERPSLILITIISIMTAGVILMVSGEVSFSLPGFLLILSAAFFSGFRWALTQILLLHNPATSNPFASIFYLAPIMFASLLLLALITETLPALFTGLETLINAYGAIRGPGILLFPGVVAFCMTSSEFALLQRTSVVTLSIAGIFKEVVTISAAALVFGDVMSPINVSGLCVTIAAIAAYNYVKIRKMRAEARAKLTGAGSQTPGKDEADGGYFAVGHDDDDGDANDEMQMQHHITADGDMIPIRPVGPARLKSKDLRTAPSIPKVIVSAGRA